MNIAHWIERHADFSPHKTALHFEGRAYTYADLAQHIEATARMLKWELGVGRGDRIAHLGYNTPEFLFLFFACARLGAMLVPLNWRLAVAEHRFILQNASVKAFFGEEEFADRIPPIKEALPHCQIIGLDFTPAEGNRFDALVAQAHGDSYNPHITLDTPLLIVYTSGTTGRPKGAVLTQNAIQWNAINSMHCHNMTGEDHVLTVLPLFHVGGLNNQTTPAFHCGATVTLHRRFHPDHTLQAITEQQPTLSCFVPATMQACQASPLWAETDFSPLRAIMTGSTTVPESLCHPFRENGVHVLEMYGATETGPIAIYQRPDSDFSKVGSTGLPALHCQVRVVDQAGQEVPVGQPGEIAIKGPSILFEYWGNEAATTEALRNGWYHTGDIGYRDTDGYYFIQDRKKNMIISGGENIYPAEVERVLYNHPGVQDVAIIGVPDERWQEVPVAVIVPKDGDSLDEAKLQTFMADQLARFKIPRRFIFTDDLPRNAMGKIQHFRVRKMFGEKN